MDFACPEPVPKPPSSSPQGPVALLWTDWGWAVALQVSPVALPWTGEGWAYLYRVSQVLLVLGDCLHLPAGGRVQAGV